LASLGHPSKFQRVSRLGFVTAPTSLNGDQQNFAGCLAVSWAGTLCIHFGGSCPLTEFCQLQNSLCVQVLRSPILAALLHGTRVAAVSQTKLCGVVQGMELRNFRRGHHLYSAERPSRWAPAHILVYFCFFVCHSNISGTAERICAIFIGRRVWTLAWTSWNV